MAAPLESLDYDARLELSKLADELLDSVDADEQLTILDELRNLAEAAKEKINATA